MSRDDATAAYVPSGDAAPDADAPRVIPEGTVLRDRYRVGPLLGQGGMGEVYRAEDVTLLRPVAVKVVRPRGDASWERTVAREGFRDDFAGEARLGAALSHPGIAAVFDFGFHAGEPFIVFEYVDGETLADTLERRGALPLDEARLILAPLAQALDAAHARHVVHRDLKPANVRSDRYGHYKLLDLGLARDYSGDHDWSFAGTPRYASPEQAAGLPCDGRTDQYALGLIAYEMLAGRPAFDGTGVTELLRRHREEPPPGLREACPDAPASAAEAVARALAKDPNARYSDCAQFARALGCEFLSAGRGAGAVAPLLLARADVVNASFTNPRIRISKADGRAALVLDADTLWVWHRGALGRWPLAAVRVVPKWAAGKTLSLTVGGKPHAFRLRGRAERKAWEDALRDRAPRGDAPAAEPGEVPAVLLLDGTPPARTQALGAADCAGAPSAELADAGLRAMAARLGADAVVEVRREKVPGAAGARYRATGTAVRAVDADGRREFAARAFQGEVRGVSWGVMVPSAAFLALGSAGVALLGVTGGSALPVSGPGASPASRFGVPIGVALLLLLTQRPGLMRPATLGLLAGSGLGYAANVVAALAGAVQTGTAQAAALLFGMAVNPIALALLGYAEYLRRRAWRAVRAFRAAAGAPPGTDWLAAAAWAAVAFQSASILSSTAWRVTHAPPAPASQAPAAAVRAAAEPLEALARRYPGDRGLGSVAASARRLAESRSPEAAPAGTLELAPPPRQVPP